MTKLLSIFFNKKNHVASLADEISDLLDISGCKNAS